MDDLLCYHGQDFEDLLKRTKEERKLLIEGFMPEKSMIMGYATDGLGKSTLCLEQALESSNGMKVFGALEVERPINHIYILAERDVSEPAERALAMSRKLNFKYDNFAITDKLQGFNLQNEKHHKPALDIIRRIADNKFKGRQIDVIDYDPIYALCGGKLKEDEDISTLRGFLLGVQREFGNSSFILHHENRGTYDVKSKKRVGQDFYGNKFISAMCQGVFHITGKEDATGTIFTKQKDTYRCLLDEIPLTFDGEHLLSFMDESHSPDTKKILAIKFINKCYDDNQKFDVNGLVKVMGNINSAKKFILFYSSINPNGSTNPIPAKIKNCNPLGQKALYQVIEKIR